MVHPSPDPSSTETRAASATPALDEVRRLIERYPDLPPEAIVKEDLLRTGICFDEEALTLSSRFKPKSYFIFSFDREPVSGFDRSEDIWEILID